MNGNVRLECWLVMQWYGLWSARTTGLFLDTFCHASSSVRTVVAPRGFKLPKDNRSIGNRVKILGRRRGLD